MTTVSTENTTLVLTSQTNETIITPAIAVSSVVVGDIGPQGLSAYAIAVQNGFVGSEADWLDYITGNSQELVLTKGVGELATISINFTNRLAADQNITAVTSVTASPDSILTISNISFTNKTVTFKASGGSLYQGFRLDILAATENPTNSISGTVYLLNT